jgi:hypothetical protein
MKTLTKALAVAALTFGPASAASAATTSMNFESSADKSIRKLGSYTGSATYDDAAGLLTITINNTSAASGTALTGLAFNVVGDGSAAYHDGDVAGTRADEDRFDDVRGKKGKRVVKAKPLGTFEAGTALNGKFNPPGKKLANRAGIGAGESQTFTFDVAGGAGLTAADFLGGDMGLVAAFRGKKADKVGSVIVPGSVTVPGTGGNSGGDDVIDLPDIIIPPVIPPVSTGGDGNINPGASIGGTPPAAVPLPPAAVPAIATFAALALPKLKRKLRDML